MSPGIWILTAITAIAGFFTGGVGWLIGGALAGFGLGGLAQAFLSTPETSEDPQAQGIGNFLTRLFTPSQATEQETSTSPSARREQIPGTRSTETGTQPANPTSTEPADPSIPEILRSNATIEEKAEAVTSQIFSPNAPSLPNLPELPENPEDPGTPRDTTHNLESTAFYATVTPVVVKALGATWNLGARTVNSAPTLLSRAYTRIRGLPPVDINIVPTSYLGETTASTGSFRWGLRRMFSLDYALPEIAGSRGNTWGRSWFEPAHVTIATRAENIVDLCEVEGRAPTPKEMSWLEAAKENALALERMRPVSVVRMNRLVTTTPEVPPTETAPLNETPPVEVTSPVEVVPSALETTMQRVGNVLQVEGLNLGENAGAIQNHISETLTDLPERGTPGQKLMAERIRSGLEAPEGSPERIHAEEVVRNSAQNYADNFRTNSTNLDFLTNDLMHQDIRTRLVRQGVSGEALEAGVRTLEYFSRQGTQTTEYSFYEQFSRGEPAANAKAVAELKAYTPSSTQPYEHLSQRMLAPETPGTRATPTEPITRTTPTTEVAPVEGTPAGTPTPTVTPTRIGTLVNTRTVGPSMYGLAMVGGYYVLQNEDLPDYIRYTSGPGLMGTGVGGLGAEGGSLYYTVQASRLSRAGQTVEALEAANTASRLSRVSGTVGKACVVVAMPLEGFLTVDAFSRGDNYGGTVHAVNTVAVGSLLTPAAPVGLVVLIGNTGLELSGIHGMNREIIGAGSQHAEFHRLLNTPGITHTGQISELYRQAAINNEGLPVHKQSLPTLSEYPHISRAASSMSTNNSNGLPLLNPEGIENVPPAQLKERLDGAIEVVEYVMDNGWNDIGEWMMKTPSRRYWVDVLTSANYIGNAVFPENYEKGREGIAEYAELDTLLQNLKAARYEVSGETAGENKGLILIKNEEGVVLGRLESYESRYNRVNPAQRQYAEDYPKICAAIEQNAGISLENLIPNVELQVERKKKAIAEFRPNIADLQEAAWHYLGINVVTAATPEAQAEYALAKRVYETDKSDKLAQYQMLESEWRMYEAQGKAMMDAYHTIASAAHAREEHNKTVFAQTQPVFTAHPELLEDAQIKENTQKYQESFLHYQSAKENSEKQKLALGAFGDDEKRQQLMESGDEAFLQAMLQSRQAEQELMLRYLQMTHAQSLLADRREFLASQASISVSGMEQSNDALLRMVQENAVNTHSLSYGTSGGIFPPAPPISNTNIHQVVDMAIAENPNVDMTRKVHLQAFSTSQAHMIVDELKKLNINAELETVDLQQRGIVIDKGTLEAFLRTHQAAHPVEGQPGNYVLNLPCGVSIQINNASACMELGNRPAIPVLTQRGSVELLQTPWGSPDWKTRFEQEISGVEEKKRALDDRTVARENCVTGRRYSYSGREIKEDEFRFNDYDNLFRGLDRREQPRLSLNGPERQMLEQILSAQTNEPGAPSTSRTDERGRELQVQTMLEQRGFQPGAPVESTVPAATVPQTGSPTQQPSTTQPSSSTQLPEQDYRALMDWIKSTSVQPVTDPVSAQPTSLPEQFQHGLQPSPISELQQNR